MLKLGYEKYGMRFRLPEAPYIYMSNYLTLISVRSYTRR